MPWLWLMRLSLQTSSTNKTGGVRTLSGTLAHWQAARPAPWAARLPEHRRRWFRGASSSSFAVVRPPCPCAGPYRVVNPNPRLHKQVHVHPQQRWTLACHRKFRQDQSRRWTPRRRLRPSRQAWRPSGCRTPEVQVQAVQALGPCAVAQAVARENSWAPGPFAAALSYAVRPWELRPQPSTSRPFRERADSGHKKDRIHDFGAKNNPAPIQKTEDTNRTIPDPHCTENDDSAKNCDKKEKERYFEPVWIQV